MVHRGPRYNLQELQIVGSQEVGDDVHELIGERVLGEDVVVPRQLVHLANRGAVAVAIDGVRQCLLERDELCGMWLALPAAT